MWQISNSSTGFGCTDLDEMLDKSVIAPPHSAIQGVFFLKAWKLKWVYPLQPRGTCTFGAWAWAGWDVTATLELHLYTFRLFVWLGSNVTQLYFYCQSYLPGKWYCKKADMQQHQRGMDKDGSKVHSSNQNMEANWTTKQHNFLIWVMYLSDPYTSI